MLCRIEFCFPLPRPATAHIPCASSSMPGCEPHGICVMAGSVIVFCCLALFLLLALLCDCWPVVDRQLHTFFASPKKVCQKRRRKVAVPAGYPIVQLVKWEKFETRYPCRAHIRLQADTVTQAWCMHHETPATPQTRTFLIHFPPRTIGSATCEFESKAESKAGSKAESKAKSKAKSKAAR